MNDTTHKTATYTDPTTGWQSRVTVAALVVQGSDAYETVRSGAYAVVRNSHGEESVVPVCTLGEWHVEQTEVCS